MENFRDRFGLAWKQQRAPALDAEAEPRGGGGGGWHGSEHTEIFQRAVQDAVAFHARSFLEALNAAPQKTARLFDIADRINVKVDLAIPMERYLLTEGFVMRLNEDKLGNDSLKLTEAGEMRLAS